MKVTCQSCQAKYTIADEKVRGKVAKIRCKKCGTTIIVNGTDGNGPTAVADDAHASGEQWSVLVADGDQRTMAAAQVAELFASGSISLETPVWKDGMPDWLPLAQVEALRTAVEQGGRADPGLPLASLLPDVAPAAAGAFPGGSDPFAAKVPTPAAARIQAPDPAARRRPRGGSTDLFGGGGGLDEVMTSASTDPIPHAGNDKPTGARNENSVLFSLASLTGGSGPAQAGPKAPSAEKDPASGRADLRSLMAGTEVKASAAKSKIDDIINLSSGGVYSPAMLAAPVLAPAPVELSTTDDSMSGPAKSSGKGVLYAIIGIVVLIGVGAVAFTAMSGKTESDRALAAASASAKAAAEALAAALAAAEANKQAIAETAQTAADQPAQAPTVLAPGQTAPKPEPEKKASAAGRPDKPDKPDKPSGAPGAAALGVPAPAPAPAPAAPAAAGGSGDFDRAAALSALSAAATSAQSCRKGDGPTGSGRIAVTFANSGQATTANVEGPPFAGTPVGGCVAARFRGTHVPPYGGAPVTVHKTFNIN